MRNAFVEKLRGYAALSAEEAELLRVACLNQRTLPAGYDIVSEGGVVGPAFVLLEGWACRYTLLPGGGRQVFALLMPGDFCDLPTRDDDRSDHSVATLSPVRIAMVQRHQISELIRTRPALMHAILQSQIVTQGILRAWMVNIGRRSSVARVAHLICELNARALRVGLSVANCFELPLTQSVIADALGLTPVHVSRVLRSFKQARILERRTRIVTILNDAELTRIAGFDGRYLHASTSARCGNALQTR